MLPHILVFTTVVIWGWTFIATKIALAEIGPVEIYALRMAVGLPFLFGVLLLRRVPLRFERGDARPVLAGGAIFTLHILIQVAGLQTTTATNTGWIIAVTPLVLAILSFLFLRERIGWNGVGGIAVATIGIVLLVSRGRLTDLEWLRSTGDWLVLASTHTWALYTVVTRGLLRRRDPLAVTLAILVVASLCAAILFVAAGDVARVRALSPRGIAAVLYLAIAGQALGQWFWQIGVARLGAARTGVYLYVEPLATVALAVPLLGEPLHPFVAIGGGLVLTGVYVAQRGSRSG